MHPIGNLSAGTMCRAAEFGLTITAAADAGTLTIINAVPVDVADTCPDCGNPGVKRLFVFQSALIAPCSPPE